MPAIAMYCPVCKSRDTYFGRLVFPEELGKNKPAPLCPNHKKGMEQELLPARPTIRP